VSDASLWLRGMDAVRFARTQLGFEPDLKQAAVLRANARQGILNCSRQWGKSTVTAAMAVHRAFADPETLVLVLSPSERQSGEFLRKSASFVRKLGLPVRGDGDNDVSLMLPNQSRIVGLPGKEKTVRGFSKVSLLLIDEASRVEDDLYDAVRPMLAVSDGDLWLMSTPFGRRGFFYETWVNGDPDWLRIEVPVTDCPRIKPSFLKRMKKGMSERKFRQDFLCEFVGDDDSLFDEELIRSLIREDIPNYMQEFGSELAWRPVAKG